MTMVIFLGYFILSFRRKPESSGIICYKLLGFWEDKKIPRFLKYSQYRSPKKNLSLGKPSDGLPQYL
jgi:hypothetical protein